jgi:hypothetical protein
MLGPMFGALNAFVFLLQLSVCLAIVCVILLAFRLRRTAWVAGVLAGLSFALTVFVYFEIWGFTWFG